jgi:gamma-D-glutamyl-L-lysine dipeptidyl-peptidase
MSLVPVRTEPSDKAEMSTQLLFGEAFKILNTSENKKWLQISIVSDGYEGWIDVLQATPISKNYFQSYISEKHSVFSERRYLAYAYGLESKQKKSYVLLRGSVLPFFDGKTFDIEGIKYNFKSQNNASNSVATAQEIRKNLLKTARFYENTPYLWGGKSPFGIDCSGFVQQVFRTAGYLLQRDAYQQAEQGVLVHSLKEAQAGDLAFFDRKSEIESEKGESKIIHVGILLNKNLIIHARGQVRIDKIDEKGIWDETQQQYSHQLKLLRRIL